MAGRLAAAAPVAASLLAHGALLGALAGLGTGPAAPDRPAPHPPAASVPRLVLLAPGVDAGGAGEANGATLVSLDDPDPSRRPYLDAVKSRIWRRWEAPRLAPGEPARGGLSLEFTLAPGGALATAEVTESSGAAALDRAALAAVRAGAPYPPVPRQVAAGPLRVRARFVYE